MDKIKALTKIPRQWMDCKNSAERKELLKKLWTDYKQVFWYLVFGVLTTVINVVTYAIGMAILPFDDVANNMISNIIAWVVAVTFAYETNRKWVFCSEQHTKRGIAKEICAFFLARISTGLFDLGFMFVTVNLLLWPDVWMKIISNLIVIVLNFVLSKFLVFAKKKS